MKETISSLQHKHQTELQRVKEMLAATETTNTDLQKEVSTYIVFVCGMEQKMCLRFDSIPEQNSDLQLKLYIHAELFVCVEQNRKCVEI